MLSEERHKRILDLVMQNGSMSVQQLTDMLSTSESTIRRDLAELDALGLLNKVHGGAVCKEAVFASKDASVVTRMESHREEKLLIARYAASLIEADDFVYLDAGTTTEMMIDFISAKGASFVTNGFSHAKKLSEKGFLTYILGGEIKLPTESVVGEEAILSLEKYHFTKGFWGTNGINYNTGFSTPDVKEALIKEVSMAHCRKRYVVSDVSKFSQVSCVSFAAFSDAEIITAALGDNAYGQYKNVIDVDEEIK